jgi:multimeric flavodoxin WrbA
LKNPGECSFIDDSQIIRRSYINSDLVIFASPILMGFTSALLKKATDKLIPLLLPYFDFINSEVHHVGRYEKYPLIGVLLEKSIDTEKDDLDIIEGIYTRMALNFKSSVSFTMTTTEPIEKIIHEIDRI